MRVSFQELYETLYAILKEFGFEENRASLCARLFTETTCDGVYSHGLNRFPRFIKMINNGSIDVRAEPELAAAFGSLERYSGRKGAGNLNAFFCMNRAVELAARSGIGCVALADTNHWMRGGTYGWQAAEAGFIGICWTNTLANMPPWGASDVRLGNNPLVIAVPRKNGHVVLDTAMSQFSFGALDSYETRGAVLPVDGGFDADGNLTRDPALIKQTGRVLPIGFWKGSGLSLVLDMLAAMLSGGMATHQISTDPELESGISQTFIAINLNGFGENESAARLADQIIEHLQTAPSENDEKVFYPGERTLKTRQENLNNGIPVEPSVWNEVLAMRKTIGTK